MILCIMFIIFNFVGISVSFSQPSYNVHENAGLAQPVLILSEAMNCCNFYVRVNVRDITAKGT